MCKLLMKSGNITYIRISGGFMYLASVIGYLIIPTPKYLKIK